MHMNKHFSRNIDFNKILYCDDVDEAKNTLTTCVTEIADKATIKKCRKQNQKSADNKTVNKLL